VGCWRDHFISKEAFGLEIIDLYLANAEEVSGFIVSSLQGANLLAKAQRSPVPVERFKRILFTMILR
jgi:hypothetical protein